MRPILALVVTLPACLCASCPIETPAPSSLDPLLAVPDGAYAGTVVTRATGSGGGIPTEPVVLAGHCVVEILGGAIDVVRTAADANGPFGCWAAQAGSKRTVATQIGGLDFNQDQTVVEVTSSGFHYVVLCAVADPAQGNATLTGEGDVSVSLQADGSLRYEQEDSLAGSGMQAQRSVVGSLTRIGDNGTLPTPDGMNGLWINTYPNVGTDGIEIRALGVTTYIDSDGMQAVSSSGPVWGSTQPGSNVVFTFQATTTFSSDPTPRSYTITFSGVVQSDGKIVGQTTFTASDVAPKVYNTTMERVPSDSC